MRQYGLGSGYGSAPLTRVAVRLRQQPRYLLHVLVAARAAAAWPGMFMLAVVCLSDATASAQAAAMAARRRIALRCARDSSFDLFCALLPVLHVVAISPSPAPRPGVGGRCVCSLFASPPAWVRQCTLLMWSLHPPSYRLVCYPQLPTHGRIVCVLTLKDF
jgi:hypothetical protein